MINIFLGAIGACFVGYFGGRLALIDSPNERSSHSAPTPKGGGIGILAAFLLTCLLIGMPMVFWLPASLVSLLGLYGDRVELSPKLRLCIQFIAAIILISGMKYVYGNSVLGIALVIPWAVFIVGTANFYNFMDGINGISGVTGVVAFALLAFFASLSGTDFSFAVLSICISLSCLGFLPFNMPRAKVFMGDVGSILLGFVFAAMVVWLSKSLLDFICLAAFLFPFYADELTTMAVRIKDGENLLRAHRKHLYQLLANEKGIAHWKISLSYSLLQLSVGCCILLLKSCGILPVFLFLGLCYLGFILVDFRVRLSLKGIQFCDGAAK
jgi:Fuc2NAc and GlcNAc transferase